MSNILFGFTIDSFKSLLSEDYYSHRIDINWISLFWNDKTKKRLREIKYALERWSELMKVSLRNSFFNVNLDWCTFWYLFLFFSSKGLCFCSICHDSLFIQNSYGIPTIGANLLSCQAFTTNYVVDVSVVFNTREDKLLDDVLNLSSRYLQ